MSGLKTIRRRISSVKNTKQITRAMKLVSAAKLKRAQDAAQNGASFSEKLDRVVRTLMNDVSEDFSHPLLQARSEVRVRRIVMISGERGLCGGYNTNIIKAIQNDTHRSPVELEFVPVGKRSVAACRRLGWKIVSAYENLPEDATKWPITEIASELMYDFEEGRCDEVVIYYTKFVSALTQKVTAEPLLPLGSLQSSENSSESTSTTTPSESEEEHAATPGAVGYSPSPEEILSQVVPLLVKTKLYQAGLQSKASEHAARMTAMDAATNNANDLIEKLRLFYNRARQTTITRELIDIVGGAEAIK